MDREDRRRLLVATAASAGGPPAKKLWDMLGRKKSEGGSAPESQTPRSQVEFERMLNEPD